MALLLILPTSCNSPHRKETIVYQLDMASDDPVGHAVVIALDQEFKKSLWYEWHSSSEERIYLRLGISTVRQASGSSIVSVALAGVNDRGEPLILSQYVKVVPQDGSTHAASLIIQDVGRAIAERRPVE
jgi:hypothetical protein